jgi:putative FmdB family regulatory protein
MPFYEYQCRACGAQVEVMQKISDAPLKKCPECRKSQLMRLISAPVFRLKGGGWYETDFKSDKDNKRNLVSADKDASASDSSAKPAAAATDTKDGKPAASADAKPADKPAAKPAEKASRAASKTKAKASARPARRAPAKGHK